MRLDQLEKIRKSPTRSPKPTGAAKKMEVAINSNCKDQKPAAAKIVSPTNDENNNNWKFIDQVENIVFQFDESDGGGYALEVIWIHDDHEYFFQQVAHNGMQDISEKFIPLIQQASTRAKKMKAFMVRYNNELDRTWPYTKVATIAEIVSSTTGMDVVLDSVDDDYFEYIVNLVPKTTSGDSKKRKSSGGFAGSIDFSHINETKKYYVLDYIGGNAMDLL